MTPSGAIQDLQTRDKVVEVRDMSQNVVANQEVGPGPGVDEFLRRRPPEELHDARNARLHRHDCHVGGRFDTQHGYAMATKFCSR